MTFSDHGTRLQKFVHTAVLEAFIGYRPPEKQACHFDDDAGNNHLRNIRWGTPKENSDDAFRNKRRPIGEDHGDSKLTNDQVRQIREEFAAGRINQSELASRYGVRQTTISNYVTGKVRRHVSGPLTAKVRAPIKLDHAKADEIRLLVASGMSIKDVAKRFGIAYPTASNVVLGRTWKSEPEERSNAIFATSNDGDLPTG